MFSVTVIDNGVELGRHDFHQPEVTLGRVQGNDIVLPKTSVSKRHAKLIWRDGALYILDLKSTNGTIIAGRRISAPEVVQVGQDLVLGEFIVRVDRISPTGVGAPPPPPPSPTTSDDGITSLPSSPSTTGAPPPPGPMASGPSNTMAPPPPPPRQTASAPPPPPPPHQTAPPSPPASTATFDPSEFGLDPNDVDEDGSHPGTRPVPRAARQQFLTPNDGTPTPSGVHAPSPHTSALHPSRPESRPSHRDFEEDAKTSSTLVGVPAAQTSESRALGFPIRRRTASIERSVSALPTRLPTASAPVFLARRETLALLLDEVNPADLCEHYPPSPAERERTSVLVARVLESVPGAGTLSEQSRQALHALLVNDLIALGPIESYLDDRDVTTIVVEQHNRVALVRGGRRSIAAFHFGSADLYKLAIQRLLARTGDPSPEPARIDLSDGTRVNVAPPPYAGPGPVARFEKPAPYGLRLDQMVRDATVPLQIADLLRSLATLRCGVIVSGTEGLDAQTVAAAIALAKDDAHVAVVAHSVPASGDAALVYMQRELALHHQGLGLVDPDAVVLAAGDASGDLALIQDAISRQPAFFYARPARSAEHAHRSTVAAFASATGSYDIAQALVAAHFQLVVHVARSSDGRLFVQNIIDLDGRTGDLVRPYPVLLGRDVNGTIQFFRHGPAPGVAHILEVAAEAQLLLSGDVKASDFAEETDGWQFVGG